MARAHKTKCEIFARDFHFEFGIYALMRRIKVKHGQGQRKRDKNGERKQPKTILTARAALNSSVSNVYFRARYYY